MKHSNIAIFIPHLGCPNQCSFCNQKTITGQINSAPSPQQVEQEIHNAVRELKNPKEETEIAFFGGSFTAIEEEYMIALLKIAKQSVNDYGLKGIRISTRPDHTSHRILQILKEFGVTAIELGAQSMNDRILERNSRGHTSADVISACERIREYDFELGLQMMVGLYGDTRESALETACKIAQLKPDTVRVYPVVILKGTRLADLYQQGCFLPMSLSDGIDTCSKILMLFHHKGIPVIKFGLHASKEVEENMVGGIYHPALKELCENQIYYYKAKELLEQIGNDKKKRILLVNHKAVSKMVGQKRSNVIRLEQHFGIKLRVAGKNEIPLYEIELE